jgi:hypothetical protein
MALPTGSENNLSTVLGGEGSPKQNYTRFLLYLCAQYFTVMCNSSATEFSITGGTAALIALVPNEEKQKEFWTFYSTEIQKDPGNLIGASTRTVGKITVFLNDVLEFTEKSTGGLL